jgi:CRP/FNR family cyclic AMP-dependent transcriptional regulator
LNTPELLNNIPLFKRLPPVDLNELAERLRVFKVKKNDVLFRKGSEGDSLYIIQEGNIKITLPSKLGDEVIVSIFSDGDFFGEMALLDQMPRSANAVAMQPTRLLMLNRRDFIQFLKTNDTAMEIILSTLSQRLRKTDNQLEDAVFLKVRARFAKKLLELGECFGKRGKNKLEINLRLTQKDLADMIGATRESVNKEFRELREKGIVSLTDKAICIHDTARLKRRAT